MKQLRWIWILAAVAVVLTGIFLFVDSRVEKREKESQASAPRQLFYVNPDAVQRITIDSEEGHFAFDWSDEAESWMLVSADQFNLNHYAVAAICNQFCTLSSLKTVEFDCQNPAVYGLDSPVTVKVYTSDTDTEHPYILYVGDNTPTYDAYYAMVDGVNDVYTIGYTPGSVFCVAKNTLKNMFLFDTYATLVETYRAEVDGMDTVEFKRNAESLWEMVQPATFQIQGTTVDNLIQTLVRATVYAYVEDDPADLAPYGLNKPWAKLYITGAAGDRENTPMREEIWLGANISDKEDETLLYGYFALSKQVFQIKRADISFVNARPLAYMLPYCHTSSISELSEIEVDMGDVYPLHSLLELDYTNQTYHLDGVTISAENDENILGKFQQFYRALTNLEFTDYDLHAKPEGDATMKITYRYLDGKTVELGFVPFADNNFYLMVDGVYSGKTVRLNRFTGDAKLTKSYEALMQPMK